MMLWFAAANTQMCPYAFQRGNDRPDGCRATTAEWSCHHQRSPHLQNTVLCYW